MGVYAESDVDIVCKDKKSAIKLGKLLDSYLADVPYGERAFPFGELDVDGVTITLKLSSGRIQNLEYQCQELWDFIKGADGVEEMNCPFMVEGDGMSFSIEDEKDVEKEEN